MRRSVIIDQDTFGPAGTNLQSIALLLNAPDVEVLGITVPTGDHWRDQQVRHALRFLEIIGRTEVPVVPGAENPLATTPAEVAQWEQRHGKLIYNGAWDLARPGRWADPRHSPDLPEGNPTTAPAGESAADFIVRLARTRPGEIALWCAAPLTNLAQALHLEPRLPELIREVHCMGGAFAPATDAREFAQNPRREFNFRFDAEATRLVLRAPWRRLTCSPIDVSQNVRATPDLFATLAGRDTPLARYLDRFGPRQRPMWDEVAAATWIDESLVTRWAEWFLDVELDRGPHWGETLSWPPDSSAVGGSADPETGLSRNDAVERWGEASPPSRYELRLTEDGSPYPAPIGLAKFARNRASTEWTRPSEAGYLCQPTAPRPARVQLEIDVPRFRELFLALCSR
jgi:inosine-uridine nucleoside N-ribohydrolase